MSKCRVHMLQQLLTKLCICIQKSQPELPGPMVGSCLLYLLYLHLSLFTLICVLLPRSNCDLMLAIKHWFSCALAWRLWRWPIWKVVQLKQHSHVAKEQTSRRPSGRWKRVPNNLYAYKHNNTQRREHFSMPQQQRYRVEIPAVKLEVKSPRTSNANQVSREHNCQHALCTVSLLSTILLGCHFRLSPSFQASQHRPEQPTIFLTPFVMRKKEQQAQMCAQKADCQSLGAKDIFRKESPINRPFQEEDSGELKGLVEVWVRVLQEKWQTQHELQKHGC